MNIIAVDVDDTLYSFGQLARQVLSDEAVRTGDESLRRAAFAEWGQWRVPPDLIGLDKWMEIIKLCHKPEIILGQEPFFDACSTLHQLAKNNELVFISNRNEGCYGSTAEWLNNWNFPDGKLICTTQDKMEMVSHCQYIIDDRPKTLVQFVHDFGWKTKWGSNAKPRKAFGLLNTYNSSLTDVPSIYLAPNWKLLRGFLVEKGLIDV